MLGNGIQNNLAAYQSVGFPSGLQSPVGQYPHAMLTTPSYAQGVNNWGTANAFPGCEGCMNSYAPVVRLPAGGYSINPGFSQGNIGSGCCYPEQEYYVVQTQMKQIIPVTLPPQNMVAPLIVPVNNEPVAPILQMANTLRVSSTSVPVVLT